MFKGMKTFFLSTWGSLGHISQWLTFKSHTHTYANPNFDPQNHQPMTIVMVHGTADRACGGTRLARGILKHAPSHVREVQLLAFKSRARGSSIREYSQQLRHHLATLPEEEGVILVGHSRGGLVCAHAAQQNMHENEPVSILASIGICSPFQGSWLAHKRSGFFSQSVAEMNAESQFLVNLRKDMVDQPAVNYHFIYGTEDYIVPKEGIVPELVCRFPDHAHQISGHSHLSITGSARCHHLIADICTTAELTNKCLMPIQMK